MGAGKTTLLQLVLQTLWERGMIPVMVNAPQAEVDAGPFALLLTADQLQAARLLNGEQNAVDDPNVRWHDKMAAITQAIDRNRNSVVLLCDEPTHWHRTSQASLEDTPEHCARSYAEWITRGATCRRIISGWVDEDVPIKGRLLAPRLEDVRDFLSNTENWFSARDLASSLKRELTHELQQRTPWEMKLYVALVNFKGPRDVAQQAVKGESVISLLEELLDLVEGEEHKTLREGLVRLAIARTSLHKPAFDHLTRELSCLDRDLILSCLCLYENEKCGIHPLVRKAVINRAGDPQRPDKVKLWRLHIAERKSVHQRLQQELTSKSSPTACEQLEWLHHEILGGIGLPRHDDQRLRFVEQLHEFGRTLSYTLHEHQRAAEIFRLALQFDPEHPYSHHYLAFNLDWLAWEAHEVEVHYQKAIELQPTHPWWWSRWVSCLATRGRFREARSVWRDALDALSVSEEGSSEWVYLSLHRWVARWLLHWAELDFAEDVLRSIPPSLADRDMSIQTLWNLLRALRVAEQGPAVFPLTIPITQWWSANGHTQLPLTLDEQPMRLWKPCRVESVDQRSGRVLLVVADRPPDQQIPLHYHELELSREQVERAAHGFTWTDLAEGRFLELTYYGTENDLRIGLHPVSEYRDPQLIPLVPPPDRWYRLVVEAGWESPSTATTSSLRGSLSEAVQWS